jgi:hypothetical protein
VRAYSSGMYVLREHLGENRSLLGEDSNSNPSQETSTQSERGIFKINDIFIFLNSIL